MSEPDRKKPSPVRLEYFTPRDHEEDLPSAGGTYFAGFIIGVFAILLWLGIFSMADGAPIAGITGLLAAVAIMVLAGAYTPRRTAYVLGVLSPFGLIFILAILAVM